MKNMFFILMSIVVGISTVQAQKFRQYINANNEAVMEMHGVLGKPSWSIGNDENGAFRLNNDLGIGDFKFIIESDGKVGLNTFPAANLHVQGDVLFGDTSLTTAKLRVNASGDTDIARFQKDGITKMLIDSDGKVALGPEGFSPFATLDIRKGNLQVITDSSSFLPGLIVNTNYPGALNVTGIQSTASRREGYGYGGYFTGGKYGLYSRTSGGDGGFITYGLYAITSGNGTNYGVYGRSTTLGASVNYGLYGYAGSGTRNYSVYANGDLKVTSQVFIGTTETDEDNGAGYELLVDGQALVEEVKVKNSTSWPDFVFEDSYELPALESVATYIEEEGHLPGIPSAAEIDEAGGFNLGEMQKKQLQKIEELTLYLIDLQKENQELKARYETLRREVEAIKSTK